MAICAYILRISKLILCAIFLRATHLASCQLSRTLYIKQSGRIYSIGRSLISTQTRDSPLAKPNYQFEKRQKDLAKKRKKEEKLQRKSMPKTDAAQEDAASEGEAQPNVDANPAAE